MYKFSPSLKGENWACPEPVEGMRVKSAEYNFLTLAPCHLLRRSSNVVTTSINALNPRRQEQPLKIEPGAARKRIKKIL